MQPIALDKLIQVVHGQSPDGDPLARLGDAVLLSQRLAEQADHLIGYFVDEARQAGASWTAIGNSLGVSKQAAQQRFVPGVADEPREIDGVFFARFTERARRAIAAAHGEARRLVNDQIGTEHLLLGLLSVREGLAAKALTAQGVTLAEVRSALEMRVSGVGPVPARIPFAPRAKKVLRLAVREALLVGHRYAGSQHYVGTEHLLLGVLADGEGVGATVLRHLAVSEKQTREWIVAALDEIFVARPGSI